jgi:hypothetical protein
MAITVKVRNHGAVRPYTVSTSAGAITAGDVIMLDSTGEAYPAAALASNLGVVGFALSDVDAAAGGTLQVQEGDAELTATGTLVSANGARDAVFFSGPRTFSVTQASNEPGGASCVGFTSATVGTVVIKAT